LGDHGDVHTGRGRDFAEMDVEPVGKEERLAALQAGAMPPSYTARASCRDEHHDDVGRARRFSHRADVQLLRAGPLPRLSTRPQPHEHARADARIRRLSACA